MPPAASRSTAPAWETETQDMPGMSYTETIGFMEMVIAALASLRAELAKVGVDVDKVIAIVRGLQDRAVSLNQKQESLKRETVATTAELETVLKEGYARASGALDTMVASVRKDSDAARNLRLMRTEILRSRKPKRDEGAPPA